MAEHVNAHRPASPETQGAGAAGPQSPALLETAVLLDRGAPTQLRATGAMLGERARARPRHGPVVQAVWNSATVWNETEAAMLERIITLLRVQMLDLDVRNSAGEWKVISFAGTTAGATWISEELPLGGGNILHFTVSADRLTITRADDGAADAANATLRAVFKNFHQTVRAEADAQKFQSGGALDEGAMKALQDTRGRMAKIAAAYKREFIDKRENNPKKERKQWSELTMAERLVFATGGGGWSKALKAELLISPAEAKALSEYSGVQAKSLHGGASSKQLNSGNKGNTAAASAALGVGGGTGFAVAEVQDMFQNMLAARLDGLQVVLPGRAANQTVTLTITNAEVAI